MSVKTRDTIRFFLGDTQPHSIAECAAKAGVKPDTALKHIQALAQIDGGYVIEGDSVRYDHTKRANAALIETSMRNLVDYPENHIERPKIEAFIARLKGAT